MANRFALIPNHPRGPDFVESLQAFMARGRAKVLVLVVGLVIVYQIISYLSTFAPSIPHPIHTNTIPEPWPDVDSHTKGGRQHRPKPVKDIEQFAKQRWEGLLEAKAELS